MLRAASTLHADELSIHYMRARTLYDQQNFDDAERQFVLSIWHRESILGAEHVDTLDSKFGLACTLYEQHRQGEVEKLLRESVQQREKVLGAGHVDTLWSKYTLARTLYDQQKYGEAAPLFLRLVSQRESALGAAHLGTLYGKYWLACTFYGQQNFGEANSLLRQLVRELEKSPGVDHQIPHSRKELLHKVKDALASSISLTFTGDSPLICWSSAQIAQGIATVRSLGQTAPYIIRNLKGTDRNPFTDPPRGYDERFDVICQQSLSLTCNHYWTTQHSHSVLPEGDEIISGRSYRVSCSCQRCRWHLDLEIHHSSVPCSKQGFPMHHFTNLTLDSQKYERYRARCSGCSAKLSITYRAPWLRDSDITLLTAPEKLQKRLEAAAKRRPYYGENMIPPPVEVLDALATYISDSLDSYHANIPKDNRRFALSFGDDCEELLLSMGFKDLGEHYRLPQVEPPSPWSRNLRKRLEDTRDELKVLIRGMVRQNPSISTQRLRQLSKMPVANGEDLRLLFSIPEVLNKSWGDRAISMLPGHRELSFYGGLGALYEFSDDELLFSFNSQVACDHKNLPYYYDCLMMIAKARNSETLRRELAMHARKTAHNSQASEGDKDKEAIQPLLKTPAQRQNKVLGLEDEDTVMIHRPSRQVKSEQTSAASTNVMSNIISSRLSDFFVEGETSRTQYKDSEILQIARLLHQVNPHWRKTPRTYIILRTIGCLDLLDTFIDLGFSDHWFPVTERSLPHCLRPSKRSQFAAVQHLVITKSVDLEKGDKGQHRYFQQGEPLPFEEKGILGTGGFAQVDRVLSMLSFKEYARKRIPRSTVFGGRRTEDIKRFIAEIEVLKRLDHTHVVRFVGSYTDPKYMGLIMSPVADMDLSTYLAQADAARHKELRTFFGCLARGLEFLHSQKVRHKDIKPGNILVHGSNILFTDFGLVFDFINAEGSTTVSMVNGMTPRYCAPEVANLEPRNTSSDIWSLGVVFLEMGVVLKGKTVEHIYTFLAEHGSRQTYVRSNKVGLLELIMDLKTMSSPTDDVVLGWVQDMLMEQQDMRPTAAEVIAFIIAPRRESNGGYCGICCMSPDEADAVDGFDELGFD